MAKTCTASGNRPASLGGLTTGSRAVVGDALFPPTHLQVHPAVCKQPCSLSGSVLKRPLKFAQSNSSWSNRQQHTSGFSTPAHQQSSGLAYKVWGSGGGVAQAMLVCVKLQK